MSRSTIFVVLLAALLFCSCTQNQTGTAPDAGGRHATVTLQDGTHVAGTIAKDSGAELTMVGDDKITRTIPRDQVKSIEYGEPAATASAPVPAAPATSAAPTTQAEKPAAPVVKPRPAPPAPAPAKIYEVPAGATIDVRMEEAIDSSKAAEDQAFAASISKDVNDSTGKVVIPRGADAQIVILSASKGGAIKGAADLVIDLKSVTINGKAYAVETEEIAQKGRQGIGANKRTAEFTGGGAALGAIIGGIAGGGKGAAVGAASGAGAGALTQILTKGKSIKIPVETPLSFTLEKPLRITAKQ
jgi:hypothetical protein